MFNVAYVDPVDDTGDSVPSESLVLCAASIMCCRGLEGTQPRGGHVHATRARGCQLDKLCHGIEFLLLCPALLLVFLFELDSGHTFSELARGKRRVEGDLFTIFSYVLIYCIGYILIQKHDIRAKDVFSAISDLRPLVEETLIAMSRRRRQPLSYTAVSVSIY